MPTHPLLTYLMSVISSITNFAPGDDEGTSDASFADGGNGDSGNLYQHALSKHINKQSISVLCEISASIPLDVGAGIGNNELTAIVPLAVISALLCRLYTAIAKGHNIDFQ